MLCEDFLRGLFVTKAVDEFMLECKASWHARAVSERGDFGDAELAIFGNERDEVVVIDFEVSLEECSFVSREWVVGAAVVFVDCRGKRHIAQAVLFILRNVLKIRHGDADTADIRKW